uniref:Uncharacterized protein n=1 Tax=Panagrellus redivivus TaxID=6233 RepID=A0A7E4W3Q8_PANRE
MASLKINKTDTTAKEEGLTPLKRHPISSLPTYTVAQKLRSFKLGYTNDAVNETDSSGAESATELFHCLVVPQQKGIYQQGQIYRHQVRSETFAPSTLVVSHPARNYFLRSLVHNCVDFKLKLDGCKGATDRSTRWK